jgi:hypothetical protein
MDQIKKKKSDYNNLYKKNTSQKRKKYKAQFLDNQC